MASPEDKTTNDAEQMVEGASMEEGGYVEELTDLKFQTEHHRAQSSRMLAITLLALLGGSIVGHYATSVWLRLNGHADVADSVGKIFEVWLPIVSGLTSSAVTYFFTRER